MESRNYRDTLLRGIALLGLILILVLGAWGIIVLAFNVPNFLSSAGTTIANLFERDREDGDTIEVPVVSTSTSTEAPRQTASVASTGSTKTASSPKTTSSYSYAPASQPVAQLYGYADLATRIVSVVPQGSRYSFVFEISNVGSNIASYGWSFTAELPLDPTYTYNSGPQQALRPGDKIVYTLGFDMPYGGYYGYDYDRYDDRYDDDERYDECGESHRDWDAEDWFDWYQDTWDTDSDSREDWDEDEWEDWYDDFCDDRDDDDDYGYGNRSNGYVSVTANPFSSIYELNRGNNSASQYLNLNYYPTYPTYPQYPWVY